ncbi:glycosyltransferase family 4 protein [Noviherbaspirillum autotrophicum]|uniref:glycosyltransferase family 4 protein n=1 Tax=Noviherbaspirillum autotrophicum TaxID=709839 RepID=UPI0006944C83|nr:glycosyltransferase family 4 protein [Noviherbaspirillum autotrophicum]
MKILILSFYYPPDLSAGSFRTASLIERLSPKLPKDATVDIITTQPNRYHALTDAAPKEECNGNVRIRRIMLPSHKSGMRDQAKAFSVFFYRVLEMTAAQRYDLVYGTSSRLFTAVLAAVVARRVSARLYLDIRDIFVDTMKDVLPAHLARPSLPFLSAIERFAINRADRINLVSAGFLPWYQQRYPNKVFDVHPNGIDDAFLLPMPTAPTQHRERPLVLYAGNIGEGQGLHLVLPKLAQRCADRFDFLVIGAGGRRAALEAELAKAKVSNVLLRDPVQRNDLIPLYQSADVLFLHLNAYDAFLKVLPSKLFEYAAIGKPILAGVAGYAAEFIRTEIPHAGVFAPCDANAGENALRGLSLETKQCSVFIKKYCRANTMDRLADILMSMARESSRGCNLLKSGKTHD